MDEVVCRDFCWVCGCGVLGWWEVGGYFKFLR